MSQEQTTAWVPREDCLTRTCVQLPVGSRAHGFSGYVEALVRAEDLIEWAQRPAPPARVVAGLPAEPVKNRGILRVMVLQWLP